MPQKLRNVRMRLTASLVIERAVSLPEEFPDMGGLDESMLCAVEKVVDDNFNEIVEGVDLEVDKIEILGHSEIVPMDPATYPVEHNRNAMVVGEDIPPLQIKDFE